MKVQGKYRLFWQSTGQNSARLLRVYGEFAEAVLPERVGGCEIEEIGAYCFAETAHLPQEGCMVTEFSDGIERTSEWRVERKSDWTNEGMRPIGGRFLERLTLPETVAGVGNLAFYRCAMLTDLSVGKRLARIGGDAFMNCGNFHRLWVRCRADEPCGVRQILAQMSSGMEVCFVPDENVGAKVFFPEYSESYDEIAPAHIFGRNIEGEGFRARQCFREERLDFGAYDAVFLQACVNESAETLGQMAEDRLRFPFALSESARRIYEEYIRANGAELAELRVKRRDLESLRFLCEAKLLSRQARRLAIVLCAESGFAEGAAVLMQYGGEKTDGKKRYEFDRFL